MIAEKIKEAQNLLTKKDGLDDPEIADQRILEAAQILYNTKEIIKEKKKVEKKYVNLLKDYLKDAKELELPSLELKVVITDKKKIDMDEDKLKYVLGELIKKNPELSDVMTEEQKVELTVHEDVLQKYIDEGKIKEEDILPCITEDISQSLSVKKIKNGGK